MLDMTNTIVPKSDQLNNDDLRSGPRTFTIAEVRIPGGDEQPVHIVLQEFPAKRPWKPSKNMRRVLVECWGPDASQYAGQRVTLYRDPDVTFGRDTTGGIRIGALTGIKADKRITLQTTKGRFSTVTIKRLDDAAPTSVVVTDETLAELMATFDRKGIPEDARLPGVNSITGGQATDLETITQDEALQVLATLANTPSRGEQQ